VISYLYSGAFYATSAIIVVKSHANVWCLATLGRPPRAAIETVWRQTEALIELLNPEGGPMSMVNLLQDPIQADG